jgi:glutamate synthase (NADPH/NADH) large chain
MQFKPGAQEKDACAIIAFVDKRGRSTHANIVKTIEALKKMGHRSGGINDEGDGSGILTDIPRDIWGRKLEENGLSRHLAESKGFFVGHFMLPFNIRSESEQILSRIRTVLKKRELELLVETEGNTRDEGLGPRAQAEPPLFWQVGGLVRESSSRQANKVLFTIQLELEAIFEDLHIASISRDSVVYKLRGSPNLLTRVYTELMDENFHSSMALGHSRYSTNTLPTPERAQPFSMLGHNGEINTIERLRSTARVLDIEPAPGGSDSQDLNRILEGLINIYGFDPLEAMAMVFPAIYSETEQYSEELRRVYDFYRWFFPPSAQGPAAVVARHGDVVMGSVDALGLRPLWFGESDYDYFLSSEKGVVDIRRTVGDPKPLSPGEKIAILGGGGRRAEIFEYGSFQKRLVKLANMERSGLPWLKSLYKGLPGRRSGKKGAKPRPADYLDRKSAGFSMDEMTSQKVLGAFGWTKYDLNMCEKVARSGRDVIGSMGYQGPLACMKLDALPNISDFFKENVAVVTNPAIDREREADHFTTRVILGGKPSSDPDEDLGAIGLELKSPILLGGRLGEGPVPARVGEIAEEFGAATLEEVLEFFTDGNRNFSRVCILDATCEQGQSLKERCREIGDRAEQAIESGAALLLLDDSQSFGKGRVFVDPGLAVTTLIKRFEASGLKRNASIVVRSAAIRNLHDIMFLLGLGADALNPYLLWRMVAEAAGDKVAPEKALHATMDVLQKGMEKVMSTMGIHELCGYGRIFASIGLSRELEEVFMCPNFCSSDRAGLSYAVLEDMGAKRLERALSDKDASVHADRRRNPKVGKILRKASVGEIGYKSMSESMAELDETTPVALRHLFRIVKAGRGKRLAMDDVDISHRKWGLEHDMPLVIPAMSFGSQGENSFRAYAEAAGRLNIVCINGEGGEIPDMLGKYYENRGQQVASGRFGVFMHFLNSTRFLEIKIGQGAKPGEGGHLPGAKVSEMVSKARHCKPGIPLISPSNHHDIYSIEDLYQIISELKTANPESRVSVKIPVTANVGTIAVGVAKAGADIVSLSGFDGGTGAAREHAKKFVGLPAEVGVSEAHRMLVESGLRDEVELWADGGMRSGRDALKMIFLGADRVGMATVALMGLGCISCQRCHMDRCPKGISTQLRTKADAESRGVKNFTPLQVEAEIENLVRLLGYVGEEMRMILADMGEARLQDLVGRRDLLEQYRMTESVDTLQLVRDPASNGASGQDGIPRIVTRRPLNYLTKFISDISMDRFAEGQKTVFYMDENVRSMDRALGTYLAGTIAREYGYDESYKAILRLGSSVPGNGLLAFNISNIDAVVDGGGQDGAAKGSFGGLLCVLKGTNLWGRYVDGSTGKSFAYGAIGGTLMVQNYSDSRACIRMSGANVVFGARIREKVRDEEGNIAVRSHLKGFAFEYMTGGRAVVLGDPGPWMCAGMTGGVIYQCLYPEYGFTRDSIRRRLATGASVVIKRLDEKGLNDVVTLLGLYIRELENSFQYEEAEIVKGYVADAEKRFVMIVPRPPQPPSAG